MNTLIEKLERQAREKYVRGEYELGKLNLFTKGNAPSLLSECGFADAVPEFHNYRRGRSCQGTLPFSADDCMGEECCPFACLLLSESHRLIGWEWSGV